jgi:hypothetical protein
MRRNSLNNRLVRGDGLNQSPFSMYKPGTSTNHILFRHFVAEHTTFFQILPTLAAYVSRPSEAKESIVIIIDTIVKDMRGTRRDVSESNGTFSVQPILLFINALIFAI